MISSHFFSIFPPFPREQTVFVVMSFHPMFDHRWKNVIEPACKEAGLKPYRVDSRFVNDSILTDINRGIANARLILVDISEMTQVKIRNTDSQPYIVRNVNAMYEMGLAHAVRQPQEVLIFRSDNVQLPFDVSPIRVRSYDPDGDQAEAKAIVQGAIDNALNEIDQVNNLAVQRVIESLDVECFQVLANLARFERIGHPHMRSLKDFVAQSYRLPAINRLLSLGLIRTELAENLPTLLENHATSDDFYHYVLTPFGEAVILSHGAKMKALVEGDVLRDDPAAGADGSETS